jgi:alpha-acetolactate decarboxylase
MANFSLRLPDSQEFLQSDLTGDRRHELEKIEK